MKAIIEQIEQRQKQRYQVIKQEYNQSHICCKCDPVTDIEKLLQLAKLGAAALEAMDKVEITSEGEFDCTPCDTDEQQHRIRNGSLYQCEREGCTWIDFCKLRKELENG